MPYFYALLLCLLLAKCTPSSQSDSSSTENANQEETPEEIESDTAVEADQDTGVEQEKETQVEEELREDPKALVGIYEDATVYAGSTDFVFQVDGQAQLFRISNEIYFQIEDGKTVPNYDLPPDLLDPSEEVEGPPGGNPKWMGKTFQIIQTDNSLKLIPIK